MRVLLCVDMEGISQITDYRQLWSEFPDHWESGKEATTIDTLATVNGLLAGGATEVTICEIHGPTQASIVDCDRMPEKVNWIPTEEYLRNPRLTAEYDALFLLGCQARCGTQNGFMSQTAGRNVRVAVDGRPVTGVHINAWRSSLPVIGVTGDEALAEQLDRGLEDVPFLAVKSATERSSSTAIYAEEDAAPAVQAFARWSVQKSRERERLAIPERLVLTMSMPSELADEVDGIDGMNRTSPAIVARSVTDWWYDAEPTIARAMEASFAPLTAQGADLTRRQRFLDEWANTVEPEWLT